ncbi:DUF4230 domain-containing protein [Spirulina major]|uniref:DUF4230 domain-containing protein n=1 Tax=Spirulina major TaxID=270636 RepID=UPI0009345F86|nr:DUF4230 domain-containing protein [Spirulina major]
MRLTALMTRLGKALPFVTGTAVAIAVLVTVDTVRTGGAWLQRLGQGLRITTSEAQVDVTSLIVTQIRQASELTTAIYSLETIVPAAQSREWAGLTVGTTKLLYIAHGTVRAGIDLSQLQPEDVTIQGNALTVRLPAPEILDRAIDVERSQVYDYDRGFLNLGPDVAPDLQSRAQRETLARITAAACDQGILDQASDRAEAAIAQLLTLSGYTEVNVQTAAPQTCDLSPQPSPSS